MRTVTYHGVEFDVPGSWPVYDLAADPSTCVRFDVNAVYLGHPAPTCTARRARRPGRRGAGRADGGDARAPGATPASVGQSVNGLEAQVVDAGAVSSEVAAVFPTAGVSATLTYRDSDATVRQILSTFRSAGS